MSGSEDPVYRIICAKDPNYSITCRGGNVVFALTNPCDRYQHWIKDESHGQIIKDSEGQPAFALVNRVTGQAISHGPTSKPVPLVRYDVNSFNEAVLWTMSENLLEGFRNIRRADDISVLWTARCHTVFDGHLIDLFVPHGEPPIIFLWEIRKVLPSTCISLFRASQHTVRIKCQAKVGYNLSIDKDHNTVLLVPSNPNDEYQHWIKEMAYGIPIQGADGQEAFALVNKATGKAIKQGFGGDYLLVITFTGSGGPIQPKPYGSLDPVDPTCCAK